MSRFPGLEALILRTLEEEGEMRAPVGRLAQEYFWLAAAQLQARGLVVADQAAGVVLSRRASQAARYRYESKCRQFGAEPAPEDASPSRPATFRCPECGSENLRPGHGDQPWSRTDANARCRDCGWGGVAKVIADQSAGVVRKASTQPTNTFRSLREMADRPSPGAPCRQEL